MTGLRPAALVSALLAAAVSGADGAGPLSAAALLSRARQMVVVTTADWDSVRGTLLTFERTGGGPWTPAAGVRRGAPRGIPIVVGQRGTAWDPGVAPPVAGPTKAEGDQRAPAGVFALGTAFGFAPDGDAARLRLPYRTLTPSLECVDDPASEFYNTLTDRAAVTPDWASSERMREIAPAYRWGVVVEYNTRPVVPGRGSCIFLHVGGEGERGTAGCTAMGESALTGVMAWLDPAAAPVLVQLPVAAYQALRTAWSLPPLPAVR